MVYCDQITDPQNFGAIIRTCLYLGVDKIIVDQEKKCLLSPAVSKASAGALEIMDIYSIKNVMNFLEQCKENGWLILATGSKIGEKINLEKTQNINMASNILVMLGSENEGINLQLAKQAHYSLWINRQLYNIKEIQFPENLVDSLNVNSAASIIIENLRKEQLFQIKKYN